MAIRKPTKAQLAKHERLTNQIDYRRNAIYAFSARNDVPFSECKKLATQEAIDAYQTAINNLNQFEYEMVQQGRGHCAASISGQFFFY